MKRLLFFLAFLLLGTHCFGQLSYPSEFHPQGTGGGGYMYSPAISPHNPDHIYLNCDMGGVYHSQNGGKNWQLQANQELVSTVKGKVQFTSDPDILYVCRRSITNQNDPLFRGELSKSTDGGISWQAMSDPTATGVHRLEVDPGSTQRLLLNEYDRLYFSNDGGSIWTEVFHPSDDQMWFAGVFWDGANIYVGTNKGLLVSHNNGQSFALETHSGFPAGGGIMHLSGAKNGNITRLFAIAVPESALYAWVDPLDFRDQLIGFYRMNYAANASWTNTRGNIPANVRIAWSDMALNNIQTVWAAGDEAGLPLIYKSTNGGQSWVNTFQASDNQNVSTGWGGDYGAFSYLWSGAALGLDVANSDPDHVIITDGFGHVTTDGGVSWRATYVSPEFQNPAGAPTPVNKFYKSSGLDVTSTHQLSWLNDSTVYAANTDIGLTYSADAGATWSFARNTFYPWGTVANPNWYRMVQRPDNHHLYAALSEVNDMYLGYRIADYQVAGGGLVVKSTDQGVSWDTIYNFGHPVVWLELDANNPNRMYASVVDSAAGGVFKSNNSGQTWVKLNLPARTEGHPYNIISLKDGGLVVTFSARAKEDGVTLTESSGVYYSPDGGSSWLDRTAPAMKFYTKELVIDPHDPSQKTWYSTVWGRFTVFAGPNNAGNGGVYKTTDRGQSWTRVFASESAESLTIHPVKPGTAYLTVENGGLFFTENLSDPQPAFERVNTYPWWRPKRVFFKPTDPNEVWVTSMGGGVWKGITSASGTVNYSSSSEDFANPERGFMQFTETSSSNYSPLDASDLATWRSLNQPFGANYSIFSTLGYRGFYLEDFVNGPISNPYLTAVTQDFNAARQAGVKLVVRFAYTHKDTPPYGDAPKSIVLQHIAQLKPILLANAEVIASLNLGFIGTWGEGYYTDYFGDDSQPPYGLTAQNWNDRNEVLLALLDAMPADRSVQVRVPQMKQKAVYGAAAPANSAPLTQSEAWQNTPKARIGYYNDCFLSGFDDQGTYKNYDTGVSGSDTATFKPYFASDSRFVPVGGETCIDWNPYSNCTGPGGGGAQLEMARMHFSYLNSGWNNAVNNDWVSGGCIEEIKQRLGYRLELVQGEYPTEGRPGQTISVKIDLINKGFAAPFNPRSVWLLLRNTATNSIWKVELSDDPRTWLPGPQLHTIEHSFCLPLDIPTGNYELLLHLADPAPALTNRPEYAIRLANQATWEASTGYNKLLHQIAINNTANSPACAGEPCFLPAVLTPPTANFMASVNSGCAPLVVAYSNQSASCWAYQWNFPGGTPSVSTEANPTIVYENEGFFDANLVVSNTAGANTQGEQGLIHVLPLPKPFFSFTTSGETITFSNTTTDASTYSWNFGDGTAVNTDVNPVHIYPGPGSYNVVLTASNNCGQKTYHKLVLIACPTVQVNITSGGNPVICTGSSLSLQATTGFVQYQWQYNGTPLGGLNADILMVTQSGVYSVLVQDQQGCTGTSNAILVQESPAPIPSFSTVVSGYSVAFPNTSEYSDTYLWDFGDGSPTNSDLSPSHVFPGPGVYTINLYASNSACGTMSQSILLTLECVVPSVVIQPVGPIYLTFGETVSLDAGAGFESWLWNTGGNSQQIVVSDCDQYSVWVSDVYGCQAMAPEVAVYVSPVIEFINGTLVSSPSSTFQWLLNGQAISGANNQTFTPGISGDYTVQVECLDSLGLVSNVIPVIIVGSLEPSIVPLKVFPNPVSEFKSLLNLEIQGIDNESFQMVLTDVAGKEMLRETAVFTGKTASLDTKSLPAGAYLIQVWQKGQTRLTGMVLKI